MLDIHLSRLVTAARTLYRPARSINGALIVMGGFGLASIPVGEAWSQEAAMPGTAEQSTTAPDVVPVDPTPAETAPGKGAAPAVSRNRMIEEIVVTAQKREENLQDVPISVQAFSAEALDARGIEEPKGLAISTPGMTYTVYAAYSLIYIRGVGTDAFIPSADASVATYIDNVYYPFGHSLASALGAIERVEVLKGPQGTLFGRNSTGGAINIITKQPGPDFETEVLASHESYDKTNIRVYTNIPLSESFAVSVSGLRYDEESYYELVDSPRDALPREQSLGFTTKLGWTPSDEFSAVLGYSYINSRGGQSMSLPAANVTPLGVATGVREQPAYKTSENASVFIDTTAKVYTGDLKYNAPWFDLRLIAGYQDILSPALADYDGSNRPLVSFRTEKQFAEVTTAEFQILSNKDSWGSDWLTWIGGLFYIDSSAGYDPLLLSVGSDVLRYLANPPASGPLSLLAPVTGVLNSTLQGISTAATQAGFPLTPADLLNGGVQLSIHGYLDTKSTAGFFQTTANITDELALTLGGRYQTETRTLASSRSGLTPNAFDISTEIPLFNFNFNGAPSRDTSNFSPKAVIDYKFGDASMGYASYTKGFKSGTFNIIAIYAPTQYVEPETVTTYELGYKGTVLDGALRLNAAVFQNTIDNLQVSTVSLLSGGSVRFETAGSARIRGGEFDLLWQPLPNALPGLVATASGSYLHAEYTDYRVGSGFDEVTGISFGGTGGVLGGGVLPGRDFTGNKIVRTPERSGTLGLSYTFDFSSGSLEFATDAYYNSGSYFSPQNTESSREHAYTLLNARVSYFYEPWDLRVTAFGKNITDTEYHYAIQDTDFATAKLLAPPAIYGVRLQWRF